MLKHTVIAAMTIGIVVSGNIGGTAHAYAYIEQVGEGKEHAKINHAIVAMNVHDPNASALGCIEVYPGTYEEQLNDYYDPNGHNLPSYCDLKGIGDGRGQRKDDG